MPLFDFNTSVYYNTCYRAFGGYSRANRISIINDNSDMLKNYLGIQPGDTVILIGCGFGWIAEEWTNSGLGPICPVDTSLWIHSNTATESAIPIYNFDLNTQAGRDSALSTLGLGPNDKATWAITEDMIACLSDSENLELAANLRLIANNVAHWTSIPIDFNTLLAHNWKTKQDWETFLSPDIIVPAV